MKTKSILVYAIVLQSLMICAAVQAQSGQQGAKVPPPLPVGAVQAPGLAAPPTPAALRLAAQISAIADTKCGKDNPALDCRVKALWDATQCPPADATANQDAAAPSQPCVPGGPGFEYDVVSIKPHKDDGVGGTLIGGLADGYRAVNTTMQNTVLNAYSTGLQLQITGGPSWFNDAHYDIEAKFVPEVADAMKKLSPDDRGVVRRFMMQQVLKDRLNFAAHIDTKLVPAYDLVVGKNGSKMTASDPAAKDNGVMSMHTDQGKTVLTGKGMPMVNLARFLSGSAGRPVFDKTGLTGMYDLTLEYAREQNLPTVPTGESGSSNSPATPPDTGGPLIMTALEDQLGLKLVPTHGPMQVVVIERIEKPSAN